MADYKLSIDIRFPAWLHEVASQKNWGFEKIEGRMAFVIELARQNITRDRGGPFGAALFDSSKNELIAPGTNLVLKSKCSHAHAEMLAIAFAQQAAGTHDLAAAFPMGVELVTSVEPCAMCLGAIPWSGVSKVVCGARDEDARKIGFDEGIKPSRWREELEARGIEVSEEVLRDQAVSVLQRYASDGGPIYNGFPKPN